MPEEGTYELCKCERAVLAALLRLRDLVSRTTLQKEIEADVGRSVSLGLFYTMLIRLEMNGLISSRLGDATARTIRYATPYFKLEQMGRRALRDADTIIGPLTSCA